MEGQFAATSEAPVTRKRELHTTQTASDVAMAPLSHGDQRGHPRKRTWHNIHVFERACCFDEKGRIQGSFKNMESPIIVRLALTPVTAPAVAMRTGAFEAVLPHRTDPPPGPQDLRIRQRSSWPPSQYSHRSTHGRVPGGRLPSRPSHTRPNARNLDADLRSLHNWSSCAVVERGI